MKAASPPPPGRACIAGHRLPGEKEGGVERQTWLIGRALAEAGWEVVFLAPDGGGGKEREQAAEKITLRRFPRFSYPFQVDRRRLSAMLDEIAPTVLYQRGRGLLTNPPVVLDWARRRGVPYLFQLSIDGDLERWASLRGLLGSPRPLFTRLLAFPFAMADDLSMRCILERAPCLLAQHEGQQALLRERLGRESRLLRTMHPELERPAVKAARPLVLWVAHLRPVKRGELFARLARACADLSATFVLVHGSTRPEYLAPVLAECRGVPNLELRGSLTAREVEGLMEEAALLVNTSSDEGFPNTFVQSWLRETPTLSLGIDPGGVLAREGIGASAASFEELAGLVRKLLADTSGRAAMGRRARKYAEERHGYRQAAPRVAEIFAWATGEGCRR